MILLLKNKLTSVLFLLKWVWIVLAYFMLFLMISRGVSQSAYHLKGEKVIWVSSYWKVEPGVTRLY